MACFWRTCRSRGGCAVVPGTGMGSSRERCRPSPSHAEVRPGVLRHFSGESPSHVLYRGLINLSCVSSFAATMASMKGADGARRHCADYRVVNSPAVRHAY